MIHKLHAIAASLALITIASFWTATVASELTTNPQTIVAVKRTIAYAIPLLAIFMAATGISGGKLAGPNPSAWLRRKQHRMKFAAINGVFILIPAAYTLYWLASTNDFGTLFIAVQAAELIAGAANMALLGLNMRDGLARRRRKAAVA